MAEWPEWRPDHIVALGGYLAPVQVGGLVVLDIFPQHLRLTVPHERRIQAEFMALKATEGDGGARARLLLKLIYWPKLLEAVLSRERAFEAKERKRKLEQERRARKKATIEAPDAPQPLHPLPPLPPPLEEEDVLVVDFLEDLCPHCTCCSRPFSLPASASAAASAAGPSTSSSCAASDVPAFSG
jgi:hypothetical protein